MESPRPEGRVVYSLNVEDLQQVAEEVVDRPLGPDELKAVEDKLGDYIDWFGAIEAAISEVVK